MSGRVWLLAGVGACAKAPEHGGEAPALVVLVVVDQLPQRLLDAAEPLLTGGLARLAGGEGAFRAVGRFPYAGTFTCPGHATIATGAAPSVHGIVTNDWYVPAEDRTQYCGEARLLRVEGVADRVAATGGQVVALSLKDRAAVMLGGQRPTASSWFDRTTMQFTAPFESHGVADYTREPWTARFPDDYAALVGADADANEADPGIGTTFPHRFGQVSSRAFLSTPFAGTALTDVALEALARFALGDEGATDLLAVSYSQTDYIGHAFTSESWEAMDGVVRLDEDLARLFAGLDAEVGVGRYAVVLTSDHGSTRPGPLQVVAADLEQRATAALSAAGLTGSVRFEEPTLYLPLTIPEPARGEAAARVRDAVAAVPGVHGAFAWRGGPIDDAVGDAVLASVDGERSGDVYVVLGENVTYAYPGSEGRGTSHGTPWADDQRVPVLAFGLGVAEGSLPMDVDMRGVAPAVAALALVPPPAAAQMGPVPGMLRGR